MEFVNINISTIYKVTDLLDTLFIPMFPKDWFGSNYYIAIEPDVAIHDFIVCAKVFFAVIVKFTPISKNILPS